MAAGHADTGSCTLTVSGNTLVAAWVCDANGDMTCYIDGELGGRVVWLQASPGSAAPTEGYDITLCDRYGSDVLRGFGRNMPATAAHPVEFEGLCTTVNGPHRLVVANAGNAKDGHVTMRFRE